MNGLNMRNSKMRIFLYCAVACGLLLVFYLLSSTHTHLKDVKGAYDICQQQKDSLLAQLQVVYEQKNRVEKFLQQEKLDHRRTKEENQQNKQSRSQLEKEKSDLESKITNLQQEQQTLQSELSQLKDKISQTEDELNKQNSDRENTLQVKETEITQLRGEVSSLVLEREQLQQHLDRKQKEVEKYMNELHVALEDNKKLHGTLQLPKEHEEGAPSQNNAAIIAAPNNEAHPKSITEKSKLNKAVELKNDHGGGGTNQELNNMEAKLNKPEIVPALQTSEKTSPKPPAPVQLDEIQPKMKVESNAVNQNQDVKLVENNDNFPKNDGNIAPKKSEEQEEQRVAPQPNIENHGISAQNGALPPPQDHLKDGIAAWEVNLKRGPQLKQPPAKVPKNNVPALQNNHPAEEDESYREDGGDDDAAEEQDAGDDGVFMAGEKSPRERQFADNDLEDNPDGVDRNHGRDGVVVQPK